MQHTTTYTKFQQPTPDRRGMNFAANRMADCAMQSQKPSRYDNGDFSKRAFSTGQVPMQTARFLLFL
jgi:hypothetical protein